MDRYVKGIMGVGRGGGGAGQVGPETWSLGYPYLSRATV